MNTREKQILKILRRDPLIQQNEIAKMLGISRSRVAGHIMDLMKKGVIKGKGYILTEQDYAVVLGAINMDVSGVADPAHLGAVSWPGRIACSAGGVGRNIAHNLALLGRDTHLISVVGDDFYGENLLEQTKRAGVNIQGCEKIHGHHTSTYISVANDRGETVVGINDMVIMNSLTPTLLNANRELVQHAGAIVLDCNLCEDAIAWVFANAADIPVFVDTVSEFKAQRIMAWLERVHTLKPSQHEAAALWGKAIHCRADVENATSWLHDKGAARVLIHRDDNSLFYSEREGRHLWLPPLDLPLVDPVGADEALMAGLVNGYLDGNDADYSVRFSQVCAALTRSSPLINNPSLSPESVLNIIKSRG
ncbi:winged helix-turn-helix transcriptional regulator [Affinibrenneria salicis]|uniref:Winged helix-turn-helix transcriptional regulator n=1 Tax=Affinibrenneria salicis TaxID=2590031 RepID=A0A5J5G216_9GAMM|nr:PfkB family carbohydrate kinase [Affinibrenneria salicis]KAA9000532.1 winged helix-turn-helix transcriptional regulator [Affinibrenneria salicis]